MAYFPECSPSRTCFPSTQRSDMVRLIHPSLVRSPVPHHFSLFLAQKLSLLRAPTPTLLPKTSTWQRTLWKPCSKQQLTAGAHTNMGQEVFLYWGLVMLRGMQLPGMLHIENMPHKSFLRQQPNSLLLCTYKAQQEMGTALLPVCALPMFFIWRNIFVQKSASQAFPCPLGGQPFCLYFPQEWQLWSCYSLRGHVSQQKQNRATKGFHMDSLNLTAQLQLCLRNFKHRTCEKLFQNKKERVGNGCYLSVSKKPRKQEHMIEQRKENENWTPILRKDNMLKKQLPSNKCYEISPSPFQIHDYMKGNKEKCLYC